MNTEIIPETTEHEAPVWGVVELMGHVKMAGRLSEETRFGAALGRVDVPHEDSFVTRYFAGASIYRVTITDEATARAVASGAYWSGETRAPRVLPAYDPLQASRSWEDDDDDNPFADDESDNYDSHIAIEEEAEAIRLDQMQEERDQDETNPHFEDGGK